jgi:hypothetical protein
MSHAGMGTGMKETAAATPPIPVRIILARFLKELAKFISPSNMIYISFPSAFITNQKALFLSFVHPYDIYSKYALLKSVH